MIDDKFNSELLKKDGAMDDFKDELISLINRYSKENGSNTPDYILAGYLNDCLEAFDKAVILRAGWHEQSSCIKEFTESQEIKL